MAECKLGVVGVGKMGEYHVGVLSDMREAELVGIVDSDQKRVKIVSERYKTSNYKDYRDLSFPEFELIFREYQDLFYKKIDVACELFNPSNADVARGRLIHLN